jgi:hypothetical protein
MPHTDELWIEVLIDKELVLNALSRVAEADFFDHLEAPECRVGIAADEVVAALKTIKGIESLWFERRVDSAARS